MKEKKFMHDNFCLNNKIASRLYHDYAEDLPIIDYHCHLPPRQIAENRRFDNLYDIWLAGDHYKWRAMRTNGVPERFITGDASPREKFDRWAATVPYTVRNPLYHWTHLELKKPFGITDRLLGPDTAAGIWDECNTQLARPEFSVRGIFEQWNVQIVATTDDPTDSLEYHQAIAADKTLKVKVVPSFRPDKGMAIENPEIFNGWVDRLAAAAGIKIASWDSYLTALRQRCEFFHKLGCRISDHGIEAPYSDDYTDSEIAAIFERVRSGALPSAVEKRKFKSAMLFELGGMYHALNWTQQYHFGVLRNVNSRMMKQLGPDTGFDTIGDFEIARPLARLLDRLDGAGRLPRTILYNINPRDNELMATMAGCFQDGATPGKIQYGSGWWFLDTKDGMEKQLEALSNMGLLSRFVGMLTDSRSFLSYSRHEYFRRILCSMLGSDVEKGMLPDDVPFLGAIVKNICHDNAASYFGFDLYDSKTGNRG